MQAPPPPPQKSNNVVLWVVLAVVGVCGCGGLVVLAAVLVPVFSQAKLAAKKTQSLSNVKQSTLAVLIYAIDNPWFFGDDKLCEVSEKPDGTKRESIRGRPEAWTAYYPRYEWTGILDAEKRVLINHDPWSGDTIDFQMGGKTDLDEGPFGIVFRIIRDLFPDPSWNPDLSRWKRGGPPDNR